MKSLLGLLGLVILSPIAHCQDLAEVDRVVADMMKSNSVPGVSLAVIRDGKTLISKGYGFADLENQVPVTADTVFEIGSITKQFASAMILQLVDDGKVKLDEPIRSYLPELPAVWKGVTVRHLLNHTSGIKSFTDTEAFNSKMRMPPGQNGFLNLVKNAKLDFEPGANWSYDNSGYFILGLLVEKETGKSFRKALKERILNPLQMTHTDMNDWEDVVKNRAHGYETDDKGMIRNTTYIDMGWAFAAGGMISTVTDMAKWDAALYTDKPVKQSLLKQAWTPAILASGKAQPYGFGWALGELNGIPFVEHAGAINGFNAEIFRIPSKKLTVIVLCNAFHGGCEILARRVVTTIDPSLVKQFKPITDSNPQIGAAHKALFETFIEGRPNKELFTDEMKKRLFPEFAENVHNALKSLGPIQTFFLAQLEVKDGVERRTYHAVLAGQSVKLMVVTAPSGKISGFAIQPD